MKKTFLLLIAMIATACVSGDDTQLPPYEQLIFLEDFQQVQNDVPLAIQGWDNLNTKGKTLWSGQVFNGNGYAELSSAGSPCTAWLVSPPIDQGDTGGTLLFQSAQHHFPRTGCLLEVFVATDYAGDITTASWTQLEAVTATYGDRWYDFIPSGKIPLTGFSGRVTIAFRAVLTVPDAAIFVDNVKIVR